ncbi:hypothetical protein [Nostoc sp.]|uniref:hypothetical protein n=1 Tax=Nostoc sp. TaxID=1180 RepID=UPI002FFA851D
MDLQKFIKELEEFGEWWLSLPSTFIAYYDDLYGYPWGRMKLIERLCLFAAFYFLIGSLLFRLAYKMNPPM